MGLLILYYYYYSNVSIIVYGVVFVVYESQAMKEERVFVLCRKRDDEDEC